MQRVNVLVLRRQVHRTDAYRVYIRVLEHRPTLLSPDEVVEDGDGEEVGPYSTLEGSCDLDHPVDHLRAVLLADVVGVES